MASVIPVPTNHFWTPSSFDTIHMRVASAKSYSENSTTSKKRPPPDLMISTSTLPKSSGIPDNNDIQQAIYTELTKISKSFETFVTATETGPSLITRRSRATLEAAEYDALGQQFTTLVIISTFTANLIIGFLTLAHNILSSRQSFSMIQYEFGMFFALGGMAIHAGVIIIAGRSAALALKYAKRIPVQDHWREERERQKRKKNANYSGNESSPTSDSSDKPSSATHQPHSATEDSEGQDHRDIPSSDPSSSTMIDENFNPEANNLSKPQRFAEDISTPTTPHSPVPSLTESGQALHLSDFRRFLKTCESLQLMGTATFFLGVMVLIFIMFFQRVFPIVLLVGCVASSLLMSWMIGFWKVSATNQLIIVFKNNWRAWMEIDVDVPDQPSACSSKLKKKGKERMVEVKKVGGSGDWRKSHLGCIGMTVWTRKKVEKTTRGVI
ncbi:hypothetical protein F5887DRAFT_982105, partial [Amanita rubescens]